MVIVSVLINIPNHTIEVVGDTNFLLFNVKPNGSRRSTKNCRVDFRGCATADYIIHIIEQIMKTMFPHDESNAICHFLKEN